MLQSVVEFNVEEQKERAIEENMDRTGERRTCGN